MQVRELARRQTPRAVRLMTKAVIVGERLLDEALDPVSPRRLDRDDAAVLRVAVAAGDALYSRGYGRPIQEVAITPGKPFVVQHRLLAPGQDPLRGATIVPPRALPEGDG